jgi:S1-C subfamily serine protease
MTESGFEPNDASTPPPPPPPPPLAHKRHLHRGALAGTAAAVVLAAGIGLGHVAWSTGSPTVAASGVSGSTSTGTGSSSTGSGSTSTGTGSTSTGTGTGSGSTEVSSIAAKVDPGLVDIDTTLGYSEEEAAGTGIVLTSNGEILTNNHVIDGATSISVTDVGNGKTYSASVVGYDTTKDVAVLQLHDASGLQTASLDTSSVSVGETVVGIGNAGGTGGTPSAAGGTVTALDQSITASDEGDGISEQLSGLIETNADIQAGDSGGSLVNTAGQVVGMDTAASSGFSFQSTGESSGYAGYAIPIGEAITLAKQIEAGSSSSTVHIGTTAFLGVEIDGAADGFGNATSGATVAGVITGSPAQQAGLAAGDVITSVNGQSVADASALSGALEPDKPGDTVTVGWTNDSGATQTVTVTLSSGPPQ